jgi:hypothetical protein
MPDARRQTPDLFSTICLHSFVSFQLFALRFCILPFCPVAELQHMDARKQVEASLFSNQPHTLCLCPMPYALCPHALCPTPYAPMPYALRPMPYALCPMPYALCPMPYALCPMPYAPAYFFLPSATEPTLLLNESRFTKPVSFP